MKAFGIVLIVFGLMAGASAASLNMQAEKAGKPQRERFLEGVGGALCSLTLVGGGTLLAWLGGRKPSEDGYRKPGKGREDDPRVKNPWDAGPG